MINVMDREEEEKGMNPHLWAACAGGISEIPSENSRVYYFPQGHGEHALEKVDFSGFPRVLPLIPCTVSSIKYLADTENDEVYAKIALIPFLGSEIDFAVDGNGFLAFDRNGEKKKTESFSKILTQSDANNGGGLSVPRYCADSIFPKLDTTVEPPVQTIVAKDIHGLTWKFRHIYRGTPRRHLLTTGWNTFVNQKRLIAGDSVVFVKMENGELYIGIRRSKKVIPFINSSSFKAVFPDFIGEIGKNEKRGFVKRSAESVLESVRLAANHQPFEIVYYPRAGTPEFVVSAATVRASLFVQWRSGMRIKMAFETEDSLRTSWFMGTVSSPLVLDPIHWPGSPWRFLQVTWDEPDFLQNMKTVNPWLVELVMDPILPEIAHLPPMPKRPRLLDHPLEFPLHLPMLIGNPLSPSSPLCCFPDNISAPGVQGPRFLHLGFPPQVPIKCNDFQPVDNAAEPAAEVVAEKGKEGCKEKKADPKAPAFVLFGQPIRTEEQMSGKVKVMENVSIPVTAVAVESSSGGSSEIR